MSFLISRVPPAHSFFQRTSILENTAKPLPTYYLTLTKFGRLLNIQAGVIIFAAEFNEYIDMGKNITNVVFDFGGVIAPADLSVVVNRFKALGFTNIEHYLNLVRQEGFFGDFETGLIDKEQFRERVSKEVGREVTMDECRNAYMGFFFGVPERNLSLMRRLRSEGYRLSLLSNTNPFIIEWAQSKGFDGHGHSLDEYLDSFYLSYEMKVMKPDERIFRMMLEAENVAPEHVLYIDDGPKNVEAARQVGLNVVQATNGEDWTPAVLNLLA